ncbi:HepT-like ribonuclease domain-containing protein [Rhizobium terrae]|uniref:HepT-like ribonuclease domain-containing protein n=1 Tax=Rhizobium terrae TaxID=2171756 RepID=UPI001D00FDA5|nr:HepT-like ribonuclease domain-containing protein [Rhizobium terrae]
MPTKRPLTRFRDITENGEAILDYTRELDFEGYLKNRLVRDASERCLARISEAAVKLGPVAEDLFPRYGWRDIRNFGNILRHEYEGVLDDVT